VHQVGEKKLTKVIRKMFHVITTGLNICMLLLYKSYEGQKHIDPS